MLLKPRMLVGLQYNTTADEEGFLGAFTPVVGVANAVDCDYDSQEGFMYWVQYDKDKGIVSGTRANQRRRGRRLRSSNINSIMVNCPWYRNT